jgi:glycosyltransferase involved in cell wall biosynthesis
VELPKISLIITLYNQREYILKIYYCILNQSIKEIEIIFIDDASIDNSLFVVKKLMDKDRRIIYLKNKKNRGQFFSRNKGVLHSKGEYVIIIDPDDLLLNNILIKCYNMAKEYNLDIVQFYHLMGEFKKNKPIILNNNKGIYFQPETNNLFFNCETRYLWDKLIRRNIFIKSIYFMKKKFRKERFIIHNDETACFGIFKSAYSYSQLEEIGYFYNRESFNSTTKNNFLPENINGRFHSIFAIMDYYYEQSENNIYEKTKGGYRFFEYRIVRRYEDKIEFLTKGFKYINKILTKYIKSPFFNSTQRELLISFRNKITIQKLFTKKL